MPIREVYLPPDLPDELAEAFPALLERLEIPLEFDSAALDRAQELVDNPPDFSGTHQDLTHIEFVTIDPAEAQDLDQAVFVEKTDAGFQVWYAIADVASWVQPGGPIDLASHERGQTYYAPGRRYPLYPTVIGEQTASLLADGVARPAMVWQLSLNEDGELTDTKLVRALVRNREKLSYEEVQRRLDEDEASDSLYWLREVGTLRQLIEAERGGISLQLPDQEVHATPDGWKLQLRALLPIEDWNAQISLVTGVAAAEVMINHRVGVLRTLPPAKPKSLQKLRRIARGLRIPWQRGADYPSFVRSLDPKHPAHLAMMTNTTILFAGAGYTWFNGHLPEKNLEHSALATPYAHTTAPLRRLVDRYVLETCHSLLNDLPVPQWVLDFLPELPSVMGKSTERAKRFERALVNLAEALELSGRQGEVFTAIVVDEDERSPAGTVLLPQLAIEAKAERVKGELGRRVKVKLTDVDLAQGQISLVRAQD